MWTFPKPVSKSGASPTASTCGSNDTDGLKALCKWLGSAPVRVIYEATGRFHRDLEAALSKAGHGPVKVNPSRARRYAQATGNIAKTDRVDAWFDAERETLGRVLAQAGRTHAACALEALDQLHLEPAADETDLRALLAQAQIALDHILGTLRGISCRQGTVSAWGLPGPAPFDVHLRWSAARLQDILATLDRALAA